MGSLQNLGNRGSNAAQQLAAQLSRSGGSSNPGVHSHQQGMLGGSGVGSGSSWGTGKKYNYRIDRRTLSETCSPNCKYICRKLIDIIF